MNCSSSFDASPSALGYIYQIRYALLLALQKIDLVEDPDDCLVSIEKIDDISFHSTGEPDELLQTKHHAKPGNLTDRSPDIWKTVRVWSEYLLTLPKAKDATFTLVTTGLVSDDSLASWLSPDTPRRDINLALARMQKISEETKNSGNLPSYNAFQKLSIAQQKALVSSTYILGRAQASSEITRSLSKKLRTTVENKYIESFVMRLEGVWFRQAIQLLASAEFKAISLGDLVSIIDDLRSQFLPGNLPADFDEAVPEIIDVDGDERIFVEQLRLIGANNRVIRNAIINYYRACEQRSRWSREGLLKPGEIGKYFGRLKDEWEHYQGIHEMEIAGVEEAERVELGRRVLKSCLDVGAHPIRRDFPSMYVARGSYHELADGKEIGWHPDFDTRLEAANEGVA